MGRGAHSLPFCHIKFTQGMKSTRFDSWSLLASQSDHSNHHEFHNPLHTRSFKSVINYPGKAKTRCMWRSRLATNDSEALFQVCFPCGWKRSLPCMTLLLLYFMSGVLGHDFLGLSCLAQPIFLTHSWSDNPPIFLSTTVKLTWISLLGEIFNVFTNSLLASPPCNKKTLFLYLSFLSAAGAGSQSAY
jgi:hypothetical protein